MDLKKIFKRKKKQKTEMITRLEYKSFFPQRAIISNRETVKAPLSLSLIEQPTMSCCFGDGLMGHLIWSLGNEINQ